MLLCRALLLLLLLLLLFGQLLGAHAELIRLADSWEHNGVETITAQWESPSTWQGGVVPGIDDDVIIATELRWWFELQISSNVQVNSLKLDLAITLVVNNSVLTVSDIKIFDNVIRGLNNSRVEILRSASIASYSVDSITLVVANTAVVKVYSYNRAWSSVVYNYGTWIFPSYNHASLQTTFYNFGKMEIMSSFMLNGTFINEGSVYIGNTFTIYGSYKQYKSAFINRGTIGLDGNLRISDYSEFKFENGTRLMENFNGTKINNTCKIFMLRNEYGHSTLSVDIDLEVGTIFIQGPNEIQGRGSLNVGTMYWFSGAVVKGLNLTVHRLITSPDIMSPLEGDKDEIYANYSKWDKVPGRADKANPNPKSYLIDSSLSITGHWSHGEYISPNLDWNIKVREKYGAVFCIDDYSAIRIQKNALVEVTAGIITQAPSSPTTNRPTVAQLVNYGNISAGGQIIKFGWYPEEWYDRLLRCDAIDVRIANFGNMTLPHCFQNSSKYRNNTLFFNQQFTNGGQIFMRNYTQPTVANFHGIAPLDSSEIHLSIYSDTQSDRMQLKLDNTAYCDTVKGRIVVHFNYTPLSDASWLLVTKKNSHKSAECYMHNVRDTITWSIYNLPETVASWNVSRVEVNKEVKWYFSITTVEPSESWLQYLSRFLINMVIPLDLIRLFFL